MAQVATPLSGPNSFAFSEVHKCRIHPGIGIARVGNSDSPDGYFIGPEVPCDPRDIVPPRGGYKDARGYVKRQAARFRIYAYDEKGRNLGELPIGGLEDRDPESKAKVEWTVHLKNKKGAWYTLVSRFQQKQQAKVRNADIPVHRNQGPDDRKELVIDPGPRSIDSLGSPRNGEGKPESLRFDTGSFRGTQVPLGELRVDPQGRLLVLGGAGKSGSTKPDNPIGSDPNKEDFWASNDYWYDDISDGPITASVTLPNGKQLKIGEPQDSAWVVVAPPKFAPGIHSIVTLYDVMRDVAIKEGWITDHEDVDYFRDIYPILLRAADTSWINDESRRGHGFDKAGNFASLQPGKKLKVDARLLASPALASSDGPQAVREHIFFKLRNPQADGESAKRQANSNFMPPMSGDRGDRTPGEPETWLSILPSQYRKFERWKDGDFQADHQEQFLAFEEINSPEEQVDALQRAALEPCVGGPLFPGIEVPWIVRNNDNNLYAGKFRINSSKYGAGDVTKYMSLPWQADFYDCKDSWWPAARPDDVVPQAVFDEVNKAWVAGQPRISEGLEGREKWDRGLGVTTLFYRPWHNPAEAVDDPRDSERRGCDDMVRYWSELGFVVPRRTAWQDAASGDREIVHVEMERRPYAGMDVRELFHCLLNLDEHRACLPKVQEFVELVLEQARQLQLTADAFAWMDNIRPFRYDEQVFEQRMKDIYDDCADFAFTETIDGVRVPFKVSDPNHNPYFRTRKNVIERIRQLTPFNFLDGSWLRNIHRVGPVDEVNSLLFTILKEELGDGVPSQNHANIYRDLCHSFGFYPPPIDSTAFARDRTFLDCAFDSPVFQLGISEFSKRYYPEIIGMSLWLEWTVLELHRIAAMVEQAGLNAFFYRMHIAIDNAVSGHGAEIVRAVKLYLQEIRTQGGDRAVQCHWKRIWDGYVAFAYTFVIVIRQVIRIVKEPPSRQQRLEWLISQKQPYGQFNHGEHRLGSQKINAWFSDPSGFLDALVSAGKIVPGEPDQSPFFKLLEFRGGPMYHVFTEEEIKLWRDWTLELAEVEPKRADGDVAALRESLTEIDPALSDPDKFDVALQNLAALRKRLQALNPDLVKALTDEDLFVLRRAAKDFRIALWVERATAEASGFPATERIDHAKKSLRLRFENWLGWSMIRAITYIAAQHHRTFADAKFALPDPDAQQNLTVAEWLKLIHDAPNPAAPARALLRALQMEMLKRNDSSVEIFGGETLIQFVFDTAIPANDGCTALRTMETWSKAGYPVPAKIPERKVKPLRLDASLDEEECHPTGVAMGFGTVH